MGMHHTPGAFRGATGGAAGGSGLVPRPGAGDDVKVLYGNGQWAAPPGASGGEANTTSNVGSGVGLAKAKSGVDLPFKTLVAGSGISVTDGTNEVTIANTGGSSSYTEVLNHEALPVAVGSPAVGTVYLVQTSTGAWYTFNKKEKGLWRRTGNGGTLADWEHLGDAAELTLDSTLGIADDGDNTKRLQFQLSGISTATTRTATVPNKNFTFAGLDDIPAYSDTNPSGPGTAAQGSSPKISRQDHVHPRQTAITDSEIDAAAAIALSKLATNPVARANHTGTQTTSTISDFDTQVRTSRLDQMAAPTASVGMNSQKITSLLDPTSAQDAATKAYVDALANGVAPKESVRAATTGNITLSGAQTIDGVSVIAGDRVLVKNQSTGAENGIYVAAAGSWTRSADADSAADILSAFCFVEEGTTLADTAWLLTTNATITLGTTSLSWSQFGVTPADDSVTNAKLANMAQATLKGRAHGAGTGDPSDLPAADVVAATINAATGKTTPVDADELGLVDSAASNVLKKLTWANLKATLLTYFNGIYLALSGGTLTGNITFGENTELVLDAALSADGKYCGITEVVTAGETIAFGDVVYLKAADSQWYLADADADATAGAVRIAIAVGSGTDNNPLRIMTYGKIRADAKFPTLTVGAPVYLSTTAGAVQVAQPSGTDDVIRILGHANTADEMLWNPSNDYMTHT